MSIISFNIWIIKIHGSTTHLHTSNKDMNSSLFKSCAVLIFLFSFTLASSASDNRESVTTSEAYTQFLGYMSALKSEDQVLQFFSRGYLEKWMSTILDFNESREQNVNVIKKELRLGLKIELVHRMEFTLIDGKKWLSIYYSNNRSEGLYRLSFRYVATDQGLLIDGIDRYFGQLGNKPKDFMIDFTESIEAE